MRQLYLQNKKDKTNSITLLVTFFLLDPLCEAKYWCFEGAYHALRVLSSMLQAKKKPLKFCYNLDQNLCSKGTFDLSKQSLYNSSSSSGYKFVSHQSLEKNVLLSFIVNAPGVDIQVSSRIFFSDFESSQIRNHLSKTNVWYLI